MSERTLGVGATVQRIDGDLTEEEAERIYMSLENNFCFKAIDSLIDLSSNTMRFLFGVSIQDALTENPQELAIDLVRDALDLALEGPQSGNLQVSDVLAATYA